MRSAIGSLVLLASGALSGADVFFDAGSGVGKAIAGQGVLTVTGPVSDWRKYDYLVLDFVNNSFASPDDSLWITAHSSSAPNSRCTVPCHYPVSFSTNRYWMPLSGWDVSARAKIEKLSVARKKISGENFVLGRASLLRKDEAAQAYRWTEDDLRPVAESNRMFRAASEIRRRAALSEFRAKCRKAGQDASRCIGEARSSEQVRPRAAFSARPASRFSVRMARNEYESFQVLVLPDRDERQVRVGVSDLRFGNRLFSATNISVSVMGYVETKSFPPNRILGDGGREEFPELGWYPDPILDGRDSCPVAKDDVQSFWVRVRCPPDQEPGRYEGELTVDFGDGKRTFPLCVRVDSFALPVHPPCRLAITFRPCFSPPVGADPEYVKMCNWKKWNPLRWANGAPLGYAHLRRDDWARFLADYSITYDSLYHSETNLPWEVFSGLKKQGRLGFFNLGVWGENPRFKDSFMRTISINHTEAKKRGLLAHAYIYGFDETPKSRFSAISNAIAEIKAAFPDVPFLTTAFDPSLGVDEPALSPIDWFTPSITTNCYELSRVMASRAAGHKVWWYTCCFPHAPYPQLFLDAPPVETRLLLGAMAAKFRPDGFLYYQTAIWNTDRVVSESQFTDWPADSYYCYHGDGSLTRVGPGGRPLATQRLENFRDGLEDLWYARLLRQYEMELPVPDGLVRSTADFSRDPALLERWREAMADRLNSAQLGSPARSAGLFRCQVHRGGGRDTRPDNSLETFLWCWGHGVAPEADARLTKDGVAIAFHDSNLKRTGSGISEKLANTPVCELDWREIRDVDTGSYLGKAFSSTRIATMESVFAAMAGRPERLLYLDEKGAPPEMIAEMVGKYGVERQVYYTSPDFRLMERWRKAVPDGLGMVWLGTWPKDNSPESVANADRFLESTFAKMEEAGWKGISQVQIHIRTDLSKADPFCPSTACIRKSIALLHSKGITVQAFTWTEGANKDVLKRIWDLGFDNFATDDPLVLFELLGELRQN